MLLCRKYWNSVVPMYPNAQFFQAGSHLCIESDSCVHPLMLFNTSSFIPLWKVLTADHNLNILNMNMRKNFFPLRVTEHWNRLPREVVESHSLEIFKTHLDEVLCNLL